jgi:type III pantothenate kinase
MIVTDIGNTSLQFGWFRKQKLLRITTLSSATVTKHQIQRLLSKHPGETLLICSVVPKITKLFKGLNNPVYVVGKDIKVPLKCFYDKKKVGMDRLVAAFACKKLYPKARLVLDFGSAITLDFLSKKGDYQGGIILPGIGSTQKALSNCALLPKKISFKKTKKLIPTNTKDSINKGLEEGFSAMVNSLVEKYKKQLKISNKEKVVITGGEAVVVIPKLNFPYKYEPFLVLKGLNILTEESV